tara:strand:- start:82 stop:864 length:783 start_codon:yes stop_codon:yes gene_type:complete
MVNVSVALTATSTSLLVPETVKVSPPAIVCVLDPSESVKLVLMFAVDAEVIRPFASIAITGMAVADPYVAALTPEEARDTAPLETLKSPVKEATPLFDEVASSAVIVMVSLETAVSIPSPPVNVSVPPVENVSFDPLSAASVKLVLMALVDSAVILPFASTVMAGIAVLVPKDPAETPLAANETAPLLTLKSLVNDATPLLEAVASSASMVIVPELSVTSIPSPAVNVIVPPSAVAVELLPSVTVIEELASFELAILPAS